MQFEHPVEETRGCGNHSVGVAEIVLEILHRQAYDT
jgi:hypothetical protein